MELNDIYLIDIVSIVVFVTFIVLSYFVFIKKDYPLREEVMILANIISGGFSVLFILNYFVEISKEEYEGINEIYNNSYYAKKAIIEAFKDDKITIRNRSVIYTIYEEEGLLEQKENLKEKTKKDYE